MITLGVRNMARAVAFYEKGLGLPKIDSPPEVAFFNLNGTWLGLYDWDDLAEDASQGAEGQGFRGVTIAHNLASEDEVEALMQEAANAGAAIIKPAQKAAWGVYHGYFRDPDGHLWEIAHNPFMWVGPEDN